MDQESAAPGPRHTPRNLARVVFSKWEAHLRKWYGCGLPENYLAWDTETTGFDKQFDLPLEFGWCVVRDRQPINRGSFLLDWTRRTDLVEKNWLLEQLERIDYSMRLNKRSWRITYDLLKREGRDPYQVIRFAHRMFTSNRDAGAQFVGHNSVCYDNELWRNVFYEFLGKKWQWQPGETFDTGCLEKARMSLELPDRSKHLFPQPGEQLDAFFRRVTHANRRGLKWNIEACVDRYHLCEDYGVCRDALHGANMDAYCCHILTELHREEAGRD